MKTYFDWDDYEVFVDIIYKNLKDKKVHLVAIYRGGLVLGTHLSNKLNAPLSIIDFQSYDGKTKEPIFIKNAGIEDEEIVIVDDILDTGNTMIKTKQFLENLQNHNKISGYVLYRSDKTNEVDFEVKHVTISDSWVVFPWEI